PWMPEPSAANTGNIQWLIDFLFAPTAGALGFLFVRQDRLRDQMFKRHDDFRKEISEDRHLLVESLTKLINTVDQNSETRTQQLVQRMDAVVDKTTQALKEVSHEAEEGRRRVWDRVLQIEGDGHEARLDDSRRYVTKADLAEQTHSIQEMIRERLPIRDKGVD
ncbi:MAG: hypothetical protein KGL39_46055, partial [Patescibacteria group bacterium]|nr:hypothetical protein [Patescibacteria group bacterium]